MHEAVQERQRAGRGSTVSRRPSATSTAPVAASIERRTRGRRSAAPSRSSATA
jgi:hypothetical protein